MFDLQPQQPKIVEGKLNDNRNALLQVELGLARKLQFPIRPTEMHLYMVRQILRIGLAADLVRAENTYAHSAIYDHEVIGHE